MNNLLIAFPEKTEAERKKIAKKFYHNFIDMLLETVKLITCSKNLLRKRCSANWDLINETGKSGKSIQVHIGHNFNWEWGNTIAVENITMQLIAVYMPIANKIFEKIFYRLRTRFGAIMIKATHMREDFARYKDQQYLLALVADQNPGDPTNAWWVNFFGRPTPFVKGPAKGAILNNTAVIFAYIHKPGRGYYHGVLSLGAMDPTVLSEQELTRQFVRYLEDVIRQYPEMWLWSHRRWKHEWKPEYGPVID